MYEVIAAPQEQPDQAQEERRENPAQCPLTLALCSRRKASSGACPITFKFMTPTYVFNTCAVGLGIGWNPSCMILRFP